MKLPPIFRRLDARLAADLRHQRKLILAGLGCVLLTSALTTLTIPLIKLSVNAIQDAAPASLSLSEKDLNARHEMEDRAKEVAKKIDRDTNRVFDALWSVSKLQNDRRLDAETTALSNALSIDRQKARTALEGAPPKARGNPDALEKLIVYCLIVVGVYGMKYWFTRGQTYFLSEAAARLSSEMRKRLFNKLQRLPISYFSEKRAGAIQSVLTNDVNVYQGAVGIIRDSIDGPIKAIGAFVTIFYLQWQLALVALLFFPIMGSVIQRNSRKMRSAQRQVQDDLAELSAMTNEALLGTRVIRAFAAEDRIGETYNGLVHASLTSQLVAARRMATLRPMVELLGACALATVLYLCGWLSFLGRMHLGEIAAIIYALDVINQGVRNLGSVSNTYGSVQAASDRIYREILESPEADQNDSGTTLDHPSGKIEFRNVTFRYPDGTEALRNVSFCLEPGTSLALVGPSGAGKSTIADLVLRFFDPSEGQILFDGVDLRDLKLSWLRRQIGVVPQQTFLFAGTLTENLQMGKPDATDEDVREAAHMAHVDEFVEDMPERYDTQLGEQGVRLSGGQRQRVAIARALVRKPTVLLLDEATSALDAASEKAVTEALDQVMTERTTLFIAHRLTTAARADRILVLSRGEVVESGSHTDLLAANGPYAGLFRAFSGGVLD